jgi:hypothetical protein
MPDDILTQLEADRQPIIAYCPALCQGWHQRPSFVVARQAIEDKTGDFPVNWIAVAQEGINDLWSAHDSLDKGSTRGWNSIGTKAGRLDLK